MNKKKRRIPLTAVLAVILLVAAVAGYMLVIRPQKADVERLDSEIATKQTQIDAAVQAAEAEQEAEPTTSIRVADLVELAKAMPEQTDMAGAILELNAAAKSAGVEFASIQPGSPWPAPATPSFRSRSASRAATTSSPSCSIGCATW